MKFKNISLMALGGVCCYAMTAWGASNPPGLSDLGPILGNGTPIVNLVGDGEAKAELVTETSDTLISTPGTYHVEQKCPSGSYCPGDGNKYACPSNATCSTTGLIEPKCKTGYHFMDGKCIAQVEKCSGNAHTVGTNPCGDELPYCDNGVCTKCPNNGIFEPNYQKCRARCEVNEQFNYNTFKCEPLAKQCPNGYVTSKGCVKECSSLTGFPYVLHEDGLSSTKCVTKEECLNLNYDVVLTDGSCRKKKECPAWYSYDSQTGACKEVVCKPGDYRTRAGMYEGHTMYACAGCMPGNYCPDGKESIACPAGTTSQGAAKSVKECVVSCKLGWYADETTRTCKQCPPQMVPPVGACFDAVSHPAANGCPAYTTYTVKACTCPAGYSQTKPSCKNGTVDIVPLNPSLGPDGPMCYKCDVQKCTADYGAKTPTACGKDLPYCVNGVCQTKKPCTTKQYAYNGTCRTCPTNATCDGRVFTCKTHYYKYETLCRACPSNATCNGETFTCKAGYYKKGNVCTKCPTNATCTAESFTCAAGFYQTTSTCVKCATNTVSKPGDTKCTKCTNGVANKDRTQCEPCAAGTFFNGTSCSKCPTNAKCAGGIMTCNTGYKKSGNTCIKDWRKT